MKQCMVTYIGIVLLFVMAIPSGVFAAEPLNVELIIDASGSMAAKMEGKTKMDIAKDVLMGLLADFPGDAQIAVRAYGQNRKEDCDDIELLAPFGPKDQSQVEGKVRALKPVGMTPIAGALDAAERGFLGREGQHNIILLVSDGKETCKRDPCNVAKRLHQSGIQLEINVIGFNVTAEERKQLECIAKEGGGKYYNAASAKEFRVAAAEVKQQVVQPAAKPTVPPEPKAMNLLSAENGGQLLVAPNDLWFRTIDGKEDYIYHFEADQDAVFAFKDEKPATFDTFTVLIPGTLDENVKEFELLVADDSPTGTFRSMGKFQTQNVKLIKTPYQEFKFPEVTAKYLKVKLISAHGGGGHMLLYEFRLLGQLGGTVTTVASSPTPPAESKAMNLLSAENGGQLLVAPDDLWFRTIDGKEDEISSFATDEEAVFAFKEEQPATFDTFAILVPGTDSVNVKEFELLVAEDSPTGTFRSMGKFQTQNVKLIKTPYQEFKFPEVTAKYLKVKLISAHDGGSYIRLYEFRLLGQLGGTVTTVASSPTPPAEPNAMNLLSAENGGQLLVAANDLWFRTIDGKEDYIYHFEPDEEAVFAFKEEQPATFDTFAILVPGTDSVNVKEFELLVAEDSPTGTFRSMGKFQTQNVKLIKTPYQEFKFPEVTAKYLKVKLISAHGGGGHMLLYEFRLLGTLQGATGK